MKTAQYKWEFGTEEISLKVGSYLYGDGLFIHMYANRNGDIEDFADLTVNLPGYCLDENEAFVSGDNSKSKLEFILDNHLGEPLTFKGKSGFIEYQPVAFDLDKLAEFDPDGVANYKTEHGLDCDINQQVEQDVGMDL